MSTLPDRFWLKVDKSGDCWLWTARRNNRGYGMFSVGGRAGGMKLAHRVAYEDARGPIPIGLVVDHLCETPVCVRPSHMQATTQAMNVLRGSSPPARNAASDTCVHGHTFTTENTHIDPRGHRRCRTCKQLRDTTYRSRLTVEHHEQQAAS